jgi:DNA-directed RNA polymerase delta subunit
MKFSKIIEKIIERVLLETKEKADITQNINTIYEIIAIDLNINNISNKILNLQDLYGIESHTFMLIKDSNENKYFLADLSLPEKLIELDDKIFSIYLSKFGVNNRLTIDEIYSKKSNSR